jgi:hypothetical protein
LGLQSRRGDHSRSSLMIFPWQHNKSKRECDQEICADSVYGQVHLLISERISRTLFSLFQALSISRPRASHSSSHFFYSTSSQEGFMDTRSAIGFPPGPIRVVVSPGDIFARMSSRFFFAASTETSVDIINPLRPLSTVIKADWFDPEAKERDIPPRIVPFLILLTACRSNDVSPIAQDRGPLLPLAFFCLLFLKTGLPN